MSTFKYWESELEGLKDASARLEHDYQTQSEAVACIRPRLCQNAKFAQTEMCFSHFSDVLA
jgi:hypothetical protein